MTPVLTRAPRYHTLDAWRGVAALAVVLFHSFGRLSADERVPSWFEPVREIGRHGWLGVTLFFVISGYCIADQLERTATAGGSLSRFWLNRLLRIYPPYLAAFAWAVALNAVTTRLNHLPVLSAFPSNGKAWAGDLTLLHFPFDLPIYLTVSWSLAVEVGFYLVCGLGLLLPTAYFQILGFLLTAGVLLHPLPQPFSFLNFWPEFFSGMLAFWAIRKQQRWPWGWTVGSLGIVGLLQVMEKNLTGCFAAAFAAGLIALAHHDKALAGTTTARWLAAAGAFSYSIYLVHLPVLSKVTNLLARFVSPHSRLYPLAWLFGVVMAIAASWCFHQLVELKTERWRQRMLKT